MESAPSFDVVIVWSAWGLVVVVVAVVEGARARGWMCEPGREERDAERDADPARRRCAVLHLGDGIQG